MKRKRVRDASGKITTVLSIDANSPTLESDLTYVFKKNVVAGEAQEQKKPPPCLKMRALLQRNAAGRIILTSPKV